MVRRSGCSFSVGILSAPTPCWCSAKLRWAGDVTLSFDLLVDDDLQATEYHYTLRDGTGAVLWRIDKHSGHEPECAGYPTHIHLADGRIEFYPEVAFDEVIAKVHATVHST
jgi:hypothetical protein